MKQGRGWRAKDKDSGVLERINQRRYLADTRFVGVLHGLSCLPCRGKEDGFCPFERALQSLCFAAAHACASVAPDIC
jgi:hypothetical protein